MNRARQPLHLLVAALVLLAGLPPAEGGACFGNNTELRAAVQAYVANSTNTTSVALKYGHPIGSWCVDNVTDMSRVFDGLNFTESLSGWKTGKATTMAYMFRNTPFNQPLSQFAVSNVVNFTGMFFGARSFNQNISSWNVSSAKYLTSMFDGNTNKTVTNASSAFRQNLCAWNTYAGSFLNVTDMFADTSCNKTSDPNLQSSPPGPFCSVCVNSTVSSSCSPASSCASAVAASCKTTCNVSSTCFINATNFCCTNGNATSDYVKNVTSVYLQQNPTCNGNRTCLTPAKCAANVTTACSGTCAVTSTCFTNATKLCCSDRNATADYVANVTSVYLQTYCGTSCLTPTTCAANVTMACNRTCNSTSTCFVNATRACCTNGNATAAYIQNVTTVYQQTYCAPSCLNATRCAANVTATCKGICSFNATCFVNATRACCTNGNATAGYVANVTAAYRQLNPACRIGTCVAPGQCASNVATACNRTCNVTSTCFTNATKACCTDGNATAAYVQNVTLEYREAYCNASQCREPRVCARRIFRTCLEPGCGNTTSRCFRQTLRGCCDDRRVSGRYESNVRRRYRLVNPCRRDGCTQLDACARRAANRCNSTCALQSTCFVNATNSCCPGGNLPTLYRTQLKERYREKYSCPKRNATACTVDACAARAVRCSGRNCALNHVCIRNATESCCRPANLTKFQLREEVVSQLKRVCRRTCTPPTDPLNTCARRVKDRCRATCSNRNKKCFRRVIEGCCVKGRISVWSDLVMRKYSRKYCKSQRRFGLGLGLFD